MRHHPKLNELIMFRHWEGYNVIGVLEEIDAFAWTYKIRVGADTVYENVKYSDLTGNDTDEISATINDLVAV